MAKKRKDKYPRNTHELAWAAGFFDGEGYIQSHRGERNDTHQRRTYHTISLNIKQVDRRVLDRFADAVGKDGVHVYGPWKNNSPTRRPFYIVSVSSAPAVIRIIGLLWKYLSPVKRKQAKKAITDWLKEPRMKVGRKTNKERHENH